MYEEIEPGPSEYIFTVEEGTFAVHALSVGVNRYEVHIDLLTVVQGVVVAQENIYLNEIYDVLGSMAEVMVDTILNYVESTGRLDIKELADKIGGTYTGSTGTAVPTVLH